MSATAHTNHATPVQQAEAKRRRLGAIAWCWLIAALATAVFVLVLAFDPGLRLRVFESARSVLAVLGEAQLARTEAMSGPQDGTSEYLVVLKEQRLLDSARQFVEDRAGIEYEGESIYPRSFRVRLDVPVTDAKRALEAQAFVGMVLPVTPFLFCH